MSQDRKFWHGGAGGLKVGEQISSAVSRGSLPVWYDLPVEMYPSDPEKVYLTTDREHARTFAVKVLPLNTGWLYEVEPVGEVTEDPDFAGQDVCYMATSATIIRVAERGVLMGQVELVKAEAKYMRWTDGTRTHSDKGYINPPPEALELGITAEDCRQMGKWPDVATAQRFMSELHWRRSRGL